VDSVKVDFQGGAIKRIEMIKRSRERPLPSLRGRGREPIAGVNMAAERRGGNERSLALHADYIGLNSLFFPVRSYLNSGEMETQCRKKCFACYPFESDNSR